MQKLLRFIDMVSTWTGKTASYLIAVLTIIICYDIFMRYFLLKPTSWAFEATYMLYGAYAMLGAAYCHCHKGHVRMDLLYSRLSRRTQAIVEAICYIFLFFPLIGVLSWKCTEHALWAFSFGERSSSSVWRPHLWPFKILIAYGFFIFFLQGLADFLKLIGTVSKGDTQ